MNTLEELREFLETLRKTHTGQVEEMLGLWEHQPFYIDLGNGAVRGRFVCTPDLGLVFLEDDSD